MAVNPNLSVNSNIAIERVSIENPQVKESTIYPQRGKESIELHGSPVPNKLNEMFIGKVIKETPKYLRPANLTTSEVTPKQFHLALNDAEGRFENMLQNLPDDKDSRIAKDILEKAVDVLKSARDNHKILAMYRGLLLKS